MSAVRLLSVVACLVLGDALEGFALTGRVVDANGSPVAGAEVTILGRPGSVITGADGRFSWTPDPPTPFEVLVVAPGGVFMKPTLVERVDAGQELTITVEALVSERLVVSGADIQSTPGAATTSVSQAEIQTRMPSNLIQALENVAGVNQVSEGQAAVPAVRGLSAGRTLLLIDGARVTSERRVGASATYMDPDIVEGVQVARGPGSVAYGSDAFGGVIAMTTRRIAPGAPLAGRLSLTAGTGVPERRIGGEISKGFATGSLLIAGHGRDADDWDAPGGTIVNSGYNDGGVLVRGTTALGGGLLAGGYQGDFGRDIERPRNNSSTVRFFYPEETSHRITAEYDKADAGPFAEIGLNAFYGHYAQTTDQDPPPREASIAPRSAPTTSSCAATAGARWARRAGRWASTSTAAPDCAPSTSSSATRWPARSPPRPTSRSTRPAVSTRRSTRASTSRPRRGCRCPVAPASTTSPP
jgi:outer membrane receptor protein involved in Fe transport